ncbi:MAG: hypothetical protein ACKPKO_03395, partial [Candidatus Fonsibacter sp.]
ERRIGQDDDKTFDEIYDWKLDENGVPFWEKGFEDFNDFVGKVYWDQMCMPHETGYQDPGWMRPAPSFTNRPYADSSGAIHRVGDLSPYIP